MELINKYVDWNKRLYTKVSVTDFQPTIAYVPRLTQQVLQYRFYVNFDEPEIDLVIYYDNPSNIYHLSIEINQGVSTVLALSKFIHQEYMLQSLERILGPHLSWIGFNSIPYIGLSKQEVDTVLNRLLFYMALKDGLSMKEYLSKTYGSIYKEWKIAMSFKSI